MAYLFDTNAISETLRKHPLPDYLRWLRSLKREEQYTSAIVIAEGYKDTFYCNTFLSPDQIFESFYKSFNEG